MSVEFCDTNVIIYAYDQSAGVKHRQARELLDRIWASRAGSLSLQVLQESYVTLTRKLSPAYTASEARAIVADLTTWPSVIEPTRLDVIGAIDRSASWRISFWDALILIAAKRARASVVWSEDLNDGQSYDDVLVQNPFGR